MAQSAGRQRRLVLLRHGKSAWPDDTPDHERPLTPRGRRDSAAVGSWLAAQRVLPDLVLVSTAHRAQATWELAQLALLAEGAFKEAPRTESTRAIYAAPAQRLIDVITATHDDVATLMLVGHNPGMEDTARLLDDGSGDPRVRTALSGSFPTCGIAVLDVAGSWADVAPASCRLALVDAPRG